MFSEFIDIKKEKIYKVDSEILNILLHDNSSEKNIIWATDNYEAYGNKFSCSSEITIDKIIGEYKDIIKPRSKKTNDVKNKRIKDNAEVFTPSWICNQQNNLADDDWFGRKNVFNTPNRKKWETNYKKIEFNDLSWQSYVKSMRLEISCGEAPYLVSRYDTVTGNAINIQDRIGLLDRKLRIVSENNDNEEEWIKWAIIAMKSVYGFDWQGDNVLLARANLLYTFIDYYNAKFNKKPSIKLTKEVAKIISWNIWQMDGIKFVIPNSCKNQDTKEQNEIHCRIMNWETNRKVKFSTLANKR